MCANYLFVNHFLVLLFLFLVAVCSAKPHFAAPWQTAAPGAKLELPSGCYATAHPGPNPASSEAADSPSTSLSANVLEPLVILTFWLLHVQI